MNKFYEDSANNPVPISGGFLYAVKKANGATEAELGTFLSGLRKSAASAPEVK